MKAGDGERARVADGLRRRDEEDNSHGDDGAEGKLRGDRRVEEGDGRQAHQADAGEAGEVDHAQRDGDQVAHDEAKEDGELLHALGREDLEAQARDQGDSAEQQVVPSAKVLRAAAAAKARGANAQQREADSRDDASRDDGGDELDPVLGQQAQDALEAATDDDGAERVAVAHGRADGTHRRDEGEAHAHDDGQAAADAPDGEELDERANTRNEHRGLDEHRRVLDAGGSRNDGDGSQVGDEHRQDVLDAVGHARKPGDLGVEGLEVCREVFPYRHA